MRKKIFVPLILIALVFVAWTRFNAPANHSFSNTASKDKLLMELITYFMQRGHFSPKIINNDLSEKLHTTFLEALDGQKRYFLKKDIIQFERYKYALDDEFRSLNTHFFDLVYARYLERKAEAELFYSELLESPLTIPKMKKLILITKSKTIRLRCVSAPKSGASNSSFQR